MDLLISRRDTGRSALLPRKETPEENFSGNLGAKREWNDGAPRAGIYRVLRPKIKRFLY